MNYQLLHYSKDYDSLKLNFDKLKKKTQTTLVTTESILKNLKILKKLRNHLKSRRNRTDIFKEIEEEPENYNLRYDLSYFYKNNKDYDKSIKIFKFLIDKKYMIDDFPGRDGLYTNEVMKEKKLQKSDKYYKIIN